MTMMFFLPETIIIRETILSWGYYLRHGNTSIQVLSKDRSVLASVSLPVEASPETRHAAYVNLIQQLRKAHESNPK